MGTWRNYLCQSELCFGLPNNVLAFLVTVDLPQTISLVSVVIIGTISGPMRGRLGLDMTEACKISVGLPSSLVSPVS